MPERRLAHDTTAAPGEPTHGVINLRELLRADPHFDDDRATIGPYFASERPYFYAAAYIGERGSGTGLAAVLTPV